MNTQEDRFHELYGEGTQVTPEPLYLAALAAPVRFIKHLRTHYGMSLLEAKHVTDKLRRPGIVIPNKEAYDNGIERMFHKGYLVDSLRECFADYSLDTDAATYMRGKIVGEDVPYYTVSAWNEWVTRFNETAVYNPFYSCTGHVYILRQLSGHEVCHDSSR